MIDWSFLVSAVIAALRTAARGAAKKGVDVAAERTTNALFDLLKKRLTSAAGAHSLEQLASNPSDLKGQEQFISELRAALASDSALACELNAWARSAGFFAPGHQAATITGSGCAIQIQGIGNTVR